MSGATSRNGRSTAPLDQAVRHGEQLVFGHRLGFAVDLGTRHTRNAQDAHQERRAVTLKRCCLSLVKQLPCNIGQIH
jgi:hypothetical protein